MSSDKNVANVQSKEISVPKSKFKTEITLERISSLEKELVDKTGNGNSPNLDLNYNPRAKLHKVIKSSIEIDENILKEKPKSKYHNRSVKSHTSRSKVVEGIPILTKKRVSESSRKHLSRSQCHQDLEFAQRKCRFILIAAPPACCCCCHRKRRRVKDSHEYSVAQEQKNDKAKDAFGIGQDFIPGSSLEGKKREMSDDVKEVPVTDTVSKSITPPDQVKSAEKAKKRKKSHKRSKRSSSSSGGGSSSSDEESHRKKRKKEKKKKSKKSHRHRRENDSSSKSRRSSELKCINDNDKLEKKNETPLLPSSSSPCCISVASSGTPSDSDHSVKDNHQSNNAESEDDDDDEDAINSKYSLSVVDFSGHHKFYSSLPKISKECNSSNSPVEAIKRACIPLLANVADPRSPIINKTNGNHTIACNHHNRRSRSSSSDSKYSSRSGSHSSRHSLLSFSKSPSRSPTRSLSNSRRRRSLSSRSRSKSSEKNHKNKSRSQSIRSCSRSKSRSHSTSSSLSKSSHSGSSVHSTSRSRSRSGSSRSGTRSPKSNRSESRSPKSNRSRSPSIPRRRGSPSFMERRRITSARKRPIPYKRKDGVEWQVSSGSSDSDD